MSMRYVFFTFRPQINDQELFEDFLKLFLPFVKSHEEYVYSVENDNTLNKHIHCVIKGKYKDKDKFFQSFNKTNGLVKFKKACKDFTNTDVNGFDTKLVADNESDLLHVVGYTSKECEGNRWSSNMTQIFLTQAQEYYHAHRRLKAKSDGKKDWTILTTKNIHAHMEKFLDENDMELPSPILGLMMVNQRYSFCGMSEKSIDLVQAEIRCARCKEKNKDPGVPAIRKVKNWTNNINPHDVEFDIHEAYAVQHEELQKSNSDYDKLFKLYSDLQHRYNKMKIAVEKLPPVEGLNVVEEQFGNSKIQHHV